MQLHVKEYRVKNDVCVCVCIYIKTLPALKSGLVQQDVLKGFVFLLTTLACDRFHSITATQGP